MTTCEGRPCALIIMDGFGLAAPGAGNAISLAATPVLDDIFATCPKTQLLASGEAVGLPAGQMGNSEVGHLNIGAGRVVYQELTRINRACRSGELKQNPVLCQAFSSAASNGGVVHFMGLLSDGGVHSNNEHLYALVAMACEQQVPVVHIHCFMDGRDVPPSSGKGYIEQLEAELERLRTAYPQTKLVISTVSGRYYAMDRDNRWDRVERAYRAIVGGAPCVEVSAVQAMQDSYDAGVTDEFVEPASLDGCGVHEGDAVVFFNFRPDRARELTRAFVDDDFSSFPRGEKVPVSYVCLTEYDATINAPVAFPKEFPANVLADVLAQQGLRQFHIAETEKYAHVTFFLNGGIEEPKAGEERVLIKSPAVATYDLQPQMSAYPVTEVLTEAILNDKADFYVVNYANCDMVGHTGVVSAAKQAVEAVDECVGRVLRALEAKCGTCLLTADHGNADQMIAEDGSPHTAHTTAPVPLALIDYSGQNFSLENREGALCDIAPTLLDIMTIPQPAEMTGKSLLAR